MRRMLIELLDKTAGLLSGRGAGCASGSALRAPWPAAAPMRAWPCSASGHPRSFIQHNTFRTRATGQEGRQLPVSPHSESADGTLGQQVLRQTPPPPQQQQQQQQHPPAHRQPQAQAAELQWQPGPQPVAYPVTQPTVHTHELQQPQWAAAPAAPASATPLPQPHDAMMQQSSIAPALQQHSGDVTAWQSSPPLSAAAAAAARNGPGAHVSHLAQPSRAGAAASRDCPPAQYSQQLRTLRSIQHMESREIMFPGTIVAEEQRLRSALQQQQQLASLPQQQQQQQQQQQVQQQVQQPSLMFADAGSNSSTAGEPLQQQGSHLLLSSYPIPSEQARGAVQVPGINAAAATAATPATTTTTAAAAAVHPEPQPETMTTLHRNDRGGWLQDAASTHGVVDPYMQQPMPGQSIVSPELQGSLDIDAAAEAEATAPPAIDAELMAAAVPLLDGTVLHDGSARYLLPHSEERLTAVPADVAVVDTPEAAERVAAQLLALARDGVQYTDADGIPRHEPVVFACDTEVSGIDIKAQSPVGHGTVICFSVYAGPWVDFGAAVAGENAGSGDSGVRKSRLWVDLAAGWAESAAEEAARSQQAAAAAAALTAAAETCLDAGAGATLPTAVITPKPKRRTGTKKAAQSGAAGAEAGASTDATPGQLPPEPLADACTNSDAASCVGGTRSRRRSLALRAADAEDAATDDVDSLVASVSADGASRRRRRRSTAVLSRSRKTSSKDVMTEVAQQQQQQQQQQLLQHDDGPISGPVVAAGVVLDHSALFVVDSGSSSSSSSSSRAGGVVASASLLPAVAASAELSPLHLQPRTSTSDGDFQEHTVTVVTNRGRLAGSAAAGQKKSCFIDSLPSPSVEQLLSDSRAAGILAAFRPFFERPDVPKVWHNYGFDRHVLQRLGLNLAGFSGDTLHMARLHDASRKLAGGYSLEALSSDAELTRMLREELGDAATLPKRGMKERFGLLRLKADGSPAKVAQVPPMQVLHTDPMFRPEWIDYSALDAKATWNVHRALRRKLQGNEALLDEYLCERLAETGRPEYVSALHSTHALQAAEAADEAAARAAADAAQRAAQGAAAATPAPQISANGPQRRGAWPRPGHHRPPGSGALPGAAPQPLQQQPPPPPQPARVASSFTMWRLYEDYWRPFGQLLTDMEAAGVRVDREHLREQEARAIEDQQAAEESFRQWAQRIVPGAALMNVNSQVQIRQLLFPSSCATPSKAFKAPNPNFDPSVRGKDRPRRWLDFELHGIWGLGAPGRLAVDVKTDKGTAAVSGAVLWSLAGKPGAAARALAERSAAAAAAGEDMSDGTDAAGSSTTCSSVDETDVGLHGAADALLMEGEDTHEEDEMLGDADADGDASSGYSAASAVVLSDDQLPPEQLEQLEEEAKRSRLGKMYAAMGGGEAGLRACQALEQLIQVSAIDKLLTAFIQPLQSDNISTAHPVQPNAAAPADASTMGNNGNAGAGSGQVVHRVHCSLNLNTETGRLSARRPNLQNQPALEKDRYKVRKAFTAEPGKTLVVADYGQLELRLLAHMANCKSMIEAFELGGDFHSRTALGMYDYIKEDIDAGKCLLEWDEAHEGCPPPQPLLKDKYGSERRKAKILNFSIAYGKTAHGLSKDWGVSLEEAEATVERWYSDRPEVRDWQARTRSYAARYGWVNTMLGRRRGLAPGIHSSDRWLRSRAERAAINTPIQGSAADVATAAMLAIRADKWLAENGWELLLQVHDEVMLEGPRESAEEARARVVAAMANPWANLIGFTGKPLRVDLVVDANIADTWYDAK